MDCLIKNEREIMSKKKAKKEMTVEQALQFAATLAIITGDSYYSVSKELKQTAQGMETDCRWYSAKLNQIVHADNYEDLFTAAAMAIRSYIANRDFEDGEVVV